MCHQTSTYQKSSIHYHQRKTEWTLAEVQQKEPVLRQLLRRCTMAGGKLVLQHTKMGNHQSKGFRTERSREVPLLELLLVLAAMLCMITWIKNKSMKLPISKQNNRTFTINKLSKRRKPVQLQLKLKLKLWLVRLNWRNKLRSRRKSSEKLKRQKLHSKRRNKRELRLN